MDVINKKNKFISNEKHLEYLYILKKCIENSLDKKYVVSIKLHTKKLEHRNACDIDNEKKILRNIEYSIKYFENTEKTPM
jgi:hypothetical protein